MTRLTRLLGPCPCCQRPRVDLVLCTCGCAITGHRLDLKFQRCDRCDRCKQFLEAPGQEDFDAA